MLELEYDRLDELIDDYTYLTLPTKFKEELFHCVNFEMNEIDNYPEVIITPSQKLIDYTPKKYNQSLFNNIPFIKRTLTGEEASLGESGEFKTRNFDMKLKVVASENLEGLNDFGQETSKKFISILQQKLTNNFSNIFFTSRALL